MKIENIFHICLRLLNAKRKNNREAEKNGTRELTTRAAAIALVAENSAGAEAVAGEAVDEEAHRMLFSACYGSETGKKIFEAPVKSGSGVATCCQ